MHRAVPTPATTEQCEPWLQDGALCLIIYSGPNLPPGPPDGNRRGCPDLRQAPNTAPAVSGCAPAAPAPQPLLPLSAPLETLVDGRITSTRTSGSVLGYRAVAIELVWRFMDPKTLPVGPRALFSSLMTKMSSRSMC